MTKAKAFKKITIAIFWVLASLFISIYLLKLSIWPMIQGNIIHSLFGCFVLLISVLCLIAFLNFQIYKIKHIVKKTASIANQAKNSK